VILAARC